MNRTWRSSLWLSLLAVALVHWGCATKKYVRAEVGSSAEQLGGDIEGLTSQVEANQTRLAEDEQRLDEHDTAIASTSKTAQDALDRAVAAGKLAEGKLLYEAVFTENEIRFGFEKTELNDEAKAVLDEFAAPLKEKNQGIFIEVQGHTDSSGPEEYNLILGEQRAEAVRRYLNQAHSVPLHRMSVISYGESEPLADNSTREGRVQNRRVALVVLQ
jgi:outer membrane protein OmpA-like peptidoglycan-associated protein